MRRGLKLVRKAQIQFAAWWSAAAFGASRVRR